MSSSEGNDYAKTHGMSGTPTYISWRAMLNRCDLKAQAGHKYYKGKGISYDKRWNKFEAFLLDLGVRPDGKTLDRIDNDKNYSKANCRWADIFIQNRNKSSKLKIYKYKGESYTPNQIGRKFGRDKSTFKCRISRGWSVKDAIEITPHKGAKYYARP